MDGPFHYQKKIFEFEGSREIENIIALAILFSKSKSSEFWNNLQFDDYFKSSKSYLLHSFRNEITLLLIYIGSWVGMYMRQLRKYVMTDNHHDFYTHNILSQW